MNNEPKHLENFERLFSLNVYCGDEGAHGITNYVLGIGLCFLFWPLCIYRFVIHSQ